MVDRAVASPFFWQSDVAFNTHFNEPSTRPQASPLRSGHRQRARDARSQSSKSPYPEALSTRPEHASQPKQSRIGRTTAWVREDGSQ